jgi:hypothetical protein
MEKLLKVYTTGTTAPKVLYYRRSDS